MIARAPALPAPPDPVVHKSTACSVRTGLLSKGTRFVHSLNDYYYRKARTIRSVSYSTCPRPSNASRSFAVLVAGIHCYNYRYYRRRRPVSEPPVLCERFFRLVPGGRFSDGGDGGERGCHGCLFLLVGFAGQLLGLR